MGKVSRLRQVTLIQSVPRPERYLASHLLETTPSNSRMQAFWKVASPSACQVLAISDRGAGHSAKKLCEQSFAIDKGHTSEVEHFEVEKIECDEHKAVCPTGSQVHLQRAEIRAALRCQDTDLAIDDRLPRFEARRCCHQGPNLGAQSCPRRVK